jgi:hypothetical protein
MQRATQVLEIERVSLARHLDDETHGWLWRSPCEASPDIQTITFCLRAGLLKEQVWDFAGLQAHFVAVGFRLWRGSLHG